MNISNHYYTQQSYPAREEVGKLGALLLGRSSPELSELSLF